MNIEELRGASFQELIVAMDCGELAWMACLCDPAIREAAVVLYNKLSAKERAVFWKRMCFCAAPTAPQTTPTTPVSFPVPPQQPPPLAQPAPQEPSSPVQDCPQGVPAPGTFTGGMS